MMKPSPFLSSSSKDIHNRYAATSFSAKHTGKRGDMDKAKEYYLKALEIDPDFEAAKRRLVNMNKFLGHN